MTTKIEKYSSHLHRLKMTIFADDTDWKEEVEILLEMLISDRIEILRRRQELTGNVEVSKE